MVQNLTEIIQDRKQNKLILISLIIGLLNIYFSNKESQNRVTPGKSYVCFHVLVYSYSDSLSFYPIQKWHSPEFGIPLESNDGVFDVASWES